MIEALLPAILAALFGLIIGSFLNVCIHRMPRDESIVWPGSRCPTCRHALAPYDNIPLLSWLLLHGHCRHCFTRIHWRYPLVEASTGVLFALTVLTWGPTPAALKYMLFAALCVGMLFTDLETRLLPDEFTLGGLGAGLILSVLVPQQNTFLSFFVPSLSPALISMVDAGIGAAIGSGTFWLVAEAYSKIRGREGLGFGDVKMVAMLGAFLGITGAMATILVGCVAGSVIGLLWIWYRKQAANQYELPFGSFLAAAGLLIAFRGEGLLRWYEQISR
ncbi:MAG: prepilin peptidase [Acidobacteriota bacterium]